MKHLLSVLCLVTVVAHAMEQNAVHSTDNGKKLRTYLEEIGTIELRKITNPDMLTLYCYLRTIAQQEPKFLEQTPQELVQQHLREIYHVLYHQLIPRDTFLTSTGKQQLTEETARTVEGLLNALLTIKEHEK